MHTEGWAEALVARRQVGASGVDPGTFYGIEKDADGAHIRNIEMPRCDITGTPLPAFYTHLGHLRVRIASCVLHHQDLPCPLSAVGRSTIEMSNPRPCPHTRACTFTSHTTAPDAHHFAPATGAAAERQPAAAAAVPLAGVVLPGARGPRHEQQPHDWSAARHPRHHARAPLPPPAGEARARKHGVPEQGWCVSFLGCFGKRGGESGARNRI